jgi:hypothetical protein
LSRSRWRQIAEVFHTPKALTAFFDTAANALHGGGVRVTSVLRVLIHSTM